MQTGSATPGLVRRPQAMAFLSHWKSTPKTDGPPDIAPCALKPAHQSYSLPGEKACLDARLDSPILPSFPVALKTDQPFRETAE